MNIEQEYRGQAALITGGLGLIGSNLAHRLLAIGSRVTILDNLDPGSGANLFNVEGIRDQIEIVQSGIDDIAQMTDAIRGKTVLFNLAGQTSHIGSMQDPIKDLNVNAAYQVGLLETCRLHNPDIRIVFAGTRQVYGRPQYLPVDESHLLTPIDNNGVSKRAGEMYHIVYNRVHGMQTCVLRMTNVYGPRMRIKDDALTFLGWWVRQLLEGSPIQIYGDGSQIRDLNYVDDVGEALLLCAATPAASGKVYNLGGLPVRLLDLARKMIEVYGQGSYELVPFPKSRKRIDIGDYYGDYSLIRSEVGWEPHVSLPEGIQLLLDYFSQHKEHYL
jgi:UDP-glucose 4-epimerase